MGRLLYDEKKLTKILRRPGQLSKIFFLGQKKNLDPCESLRVENYFLQISELEEFLSLLFAEIVKQKKEEKCKKKVIVKYNCK